MMEKEPGTNQFDILQQMLAEIKITVNQKKRRVIVHKIAYVIVTMLLESKFKIDVYDEVIYDDEILVATTRRLLEQLSKGG